MNPLYMQILMSLLGPSDDDLMDAARRYQAGGGNFSEAGPASSNYVPPRGGPSDDELMDAAWQYQAGGGNFSEAGPASSNYAPPQRRTGMGVDARALALPILLGAAAGRLGRPTPRPRPRGMR